MSIVIGIDLGGTKISTALMNGEGDILAHDYRKTREREERGYRPVVDRMIAAAEKVMEEGGVSSSDIHMVGIGAPGPLDLDEGIVEQPPNLPGWEHVPLRDLMAEALGIPCVLENDANAAAVGEYRFGAGRGTEHMIYVTVSTGIGGGLILDGELYHGANGAAGEVGHVIVEPDGPLCGCGKFGCLEALSAGPALAREARRRVELGISTLIADLVDGDPEQVTAKVVAEADQKGDEVARSIVDDAMRYLGIGMANLVTIFNPEVIVIGGGLSNMGERLLEPVRKLVRAYAFPKTSGEVVRVVRAELEEHAGVMGAAAVALTKID